MLERFKMGRDVLIGKMDEIDPRKNGFEKDVKELYKVVYAFTGPYTNLPNTERETTFTLLSRQYACSRNAIIHSFNANRFDAWWEIYDFVTADNEDFLSFAEMSMLCMILDIFLREQ